LVLAAALGLIGLFAAAVGLILQGGERLMYVLAKCKRSDWELEAFEGGIAAFANPNRARGRRMIPEDV
jgi:hypothetical protein